jgi:hypothetical protein
MKLVLAAAFCLVASFAIAVGCRHDDASGTTPTAVKPATLDAGLPAHVPDAPNPPAGASHS